MPPLPEAIILALGLLTKQFPFHLWHDRLGT